jgi:phosphoenolpyruvate carboxykinase (ATP)
MGDYKQVLKKVERLVERSKHVGTNVTEYTGPLLGKVAMLTGQMNEWHGINWDTRVRNRSAKYSIVLGSPNAQKVGNTPEQKETQKDLELNMARVFGGTVDGKKYKGHANELPTDFIHRVMGSGADKDFTFNCNLLVTVKNPVYHHIPYMYGKMCRNVDPVPGAPNINIILVPDINTGAFGRFYAFPEDRVTVGLGSDYMGEAKKGFLRMAMYLAKKKKILGVHAGSKLIKARDRKTGNIKQYGVLVLGLSGTGKTTLVGHPHYLDDKKEASLVVQDDFVGMKVKDGTVLGTEMALYLKTDLDNEDLLMRPLTESPEFVAQNMYVDSKGRIQYLEEDLCANGRGILPLSAFPKSRRYKSLDLPPADELDGLLIFFNTRRDTIVPIIQELTPEQAAAAFMLGESIETSSGDPAKAGQSLRIVGTNPFIVGDEGDEGNMFYEFVKKYQHKVRCFLMNTGGVGEIRNPKNPLKITKPPERPWKPGIGYITRAIFRGTAEWEDYPDFGTRVLTGGVTNEKGKVFDMDKFNPLKAYAPAVREEMVKKLNKERIEWLEKYPVFSPNILKMMKKTLKV